MFNSKLSLKKQKVYLSLLAVVSLLLFLFLQLPFFNNFNRLFIDPLLGEVEARPEIVIVGIDDKSLQSIGAWPWSREVFGSALDTITSQKPSVVGIDVLFLEDREGDTSFTEAIERSNAPVVFGSKISGGQTLKSIYDYLPNAYSGFVNFAPALDGKIRETQVFEKSGDSCEVSFGLALAVQYFKEDPEYLCNSKIQLRNNTYNLNEDNSLEFNYTRQSFTRISFSDVLDGNLSEDFFENKIVLIGSTALDVRSELNDNFTDIFGQTIPGVQIHANILNSFLQNSFLNSPSFLITGVIYSIFALVFAFLFLQIKKALYDLTALIALEIIIFILAITLLSFGIVIPFIQIAIFIFGIFIFSLSYRYLTKTRENQFVKSIFSRYLNKDLLNILLENSDRLKLGGETRNMTVMFSDIRSFTTISESLTPKQLIDMLNDYLGYMTKIILKNSGTVDKYIGDAIMAFWNAPLDDENHAANAINAALNMRDQLEEFGKMHPEYPEINIGIGLNTGDMTVGNVGGEARFDYTVLGDNVNLGSRLEGLTKKYGVTIIVSESTKNAYEEIYKLRKQDQDDNENNDFKFRLLDDMKVKGKNDSVRIYQPFRLQEYESYKNEIEIYSSGFDLYQRGDFEEAVKVLGKNKNDKPSILLIERIQTLLQNPPDDWHGIWKWDEK